MRRIPLRAFLLALLSSALLHAADIPEKYRGDWLLVNGTLVLSLDASGTMRIPGTDQQGPLKLNADNTFLWQLKGITQSGNFSGETLFLRNDVKNAPRWIQVLEFRKGTPDETQGVLIAASEERKQALNAFAKVKQSALEKSMLNDARQLGGAAQQHILMENLPTSSVVFLEVDPATGIVSGPLTLFVSKITPGTKVVDNRYEASDSATFSLQNPGAYDGLEIIFDAEGKLKK